MFQEQSASQFSVSKMDEAALAKVQEDRDRKLLQKLWGLDSAPTREDLSDILGIPSDDPRFDVALARLINKELKNRPGGQ